MTVEPWAVILEGLSSYAAILAAYLLARPAIRFEESQMISNLLSQGADEQNEAGVKALLRELRTAHSKQQISARYHHGLMYLGGWISLGLSALLFLGAILLHIYGSEPATQKIGIGFADHMTSS